MTNTETVGTAPEAIWATPTRITYDNPDWSRGEYYDEHGAAGLGVKYIRADLASRTQEPAEWQVDRDELAQLIHDAGAPPRPPCPPIRSLPETHFVRVAAYRQADAVLALRAASIPAPERYKEEVYTAEDGLRRARQIALQSEAAPLSMGEIIKVADMALDEETPIPEWMTDPAFYAAPVPVPVTITDEMANAAIARSKQKDLDLLTNTEAMRQIIAAALSVKPGEQG